MRCVVGTGTATSRMSPCRGRMGAGVGPPKVSGHAEGWNRQDKMERLVMKDVEESGDV